MCVRTRACVGGGGGVGWGEGSHTRSSLNSAASISPIVITPDEADAPVEPAGPVPYPTALRACALYGTCSMQRGPVSRAPHRVRHADMAPTFFGRAELQREERPDEARIRRGELVEQRHEWRRLQRFDVSASNSGRGAEQNAHHCGAQRTRRGSTGPFAGYSGYSHGCYSHGYSEYSCLIARTRNAALGHLRLGDRLVREAEDALRPARLQHGNARDCNTHCATPRDATDNRRRATDDVRQDNVPRGACMPHAADEAQPCGRQRLA